ncbi:hypothetical protein SAMN05421837_102804 [Amycolatopsis pretoriensis]|uniref:Uncharacterized protein n=1 Tax=Amycolatopsis pretoriensis TaxID=218821 RepID=A0A1H5QEU4_9PSEU|nr:DUF6002 family protein [Amycolatopsis pretoriensis]SEF24652.1 hypothetical protein SAMN05421837_102804 [Amycolatopsis pretoriensis]
MTSAADQTGAVNIVQNALSRYHEHIRAVARVVTAARGGDLAIPLEPLEVFEEFTDVTDIGLSQVGENMFLFDLMRNPGARTTKTMASLLMVSRAVSHIRRTGERILVFTPTSGNKGTALRDAIARAYECGLVTPEQLRMVMLVPESSRVKLRDCALTWEGALHSVNPVAMVNVDQPADVKQLSAKVVAAQAAEIMDTTGFRVWYTLDLDNYRIADAARAFVEAELLPVTEDSPPRFHAHAVSSAFGLLGYHLGFEALATGLPGLSVPANHPGFFLVQQLATPDMVTSLLGTKVPDYEYDSAAGLWRQGAALEFPAVTDAPEETIDATFYTKSPATSAQVNAIVGRYGGGGVVVSKRECLDRFDRVRAVASNAGIEIGADPASIREWSLIKVLTGVLVARERGLIAADTDVVVHGSGCYDDSSLPPMRDEHITRVSTLAELAALVRDTASA